MSDGGGVASGRGRGAAEGKLVYRECFVTCFESFPLLCGHTAQSFPTMFPSLLYRTMDDVVVAAYRMGVCACGSTKASCAADSSSHSWSVPIETFAQRRTK